MTPSGPPLKNVQLESLELKITPQNILVKPGDENWRDETCNELTMGTNLLVKRAPPEPLAPCLKQKGDKQRKSVHFEVEEEGSFNSDIEDSLEVIHPEANRAVKIPIPAA